MKLVKNNPALLKVIFFLKKFQKSEEKTISYCKVLFYDDVIKKYNHN